MRKIIRIDEEACNGCGLCAQACHEGAIGMVNGKARLLRDDYCDGLGDCLPACPVGAITFEEREALAYDEEAVRARQAEQQRVEPLACGCPGTHARAIKHEAKPAAHSAPAPQEESRLAQWPVQLKLVPVKAPYFDKADLLIAADCTAYAYGGFHSRFMTNRVTLIGCPKLDAEDYADKLTEILLHNDIQSITVTRMEVPCCSGIVNAVRTALQRSGRVIPWQVVTITTDGREMVR